jgi:hypothetical protein
MEEKKSDHTNEYISFRYDSGKSKKNVNEISIIKSFDKDSSINASRIKRKIY